MLRTFLSDTIAKRTFQSLTDQELLKSYKRKKEKKVISEFFNRYIHLVYSVCMKYMQDEEKARDQAMLVFELLGEKMIKFEISNFKSWLLTMSRNNCLMELRKKKREYAIGDQEISRLYLVEKEDETHHQQEEESRKQVVNSLHSLKECQRICLEMMYFQNKSYKDIALETGYTIKEVKSYIQNGKRNLRGVLKDNYGEGR